MELNLSTFTLEILNFLVLIWILKRLFFTPILATIDRRRAMIARVTEDANSLRREAEEVKVEYEKQRRNWEAEVKIARERLRNELEQERAERMAQLNAELAAERDRNAVLDARHQAEELQSLNRQAMELGAQFTARLLEGLACPELEARMIELTLNAIGRLPAEVANSIRSQLEMDSAQLEIASAFPIDSETRNRFNQALREVSGLPLLECSFKESPALLAGCRLSIGAWTLALNLRDELRDFVSQV